jgi:hypothetical protein
VEFIGTLPLLALAATVCVQALLVALALVFAQSAADRAASGASSERVLASIPSGWRARTTLDARGARATVRIEPPSLLPGAASKLTVRASSEVPR